MKRIALRDVFVVGLIPLAASLAVFSWTAEYGPGISGDSYTYTSMSKHIADGQGAKYYNNTTGGKSIPMTWFAPLWPTVLAPLHHLPVPYQQSAEALLIGIFCLNLFVAGWVLKDVTGRLWPAALAQVIFLADTNWLTWHLHLLTEGLFFLQLNLSAWLLWRLIRDKKIIWVAGLAAVVALLPLNRYVGVAFLPGYILALIWVFGWTRKTVLAAGCFTVAIFVPFVAWLCRNYLVSGIGYDKSLPGVDVSRYFPWEMTQSIAQNIFFYPFRTFYGAGLWGWVIWLTVLLVLAFFTAPLIAARVRTSKNREARARAAEPRARAVDSADALRRRWIAASAGIASIYAVGLGAAMAWRHMSGMSDEVRYLTPFFHWVWLVVVAAVGIFCVRPATVTVGSRSGSESGIGKAVKASILAAVFVASFLQFAGWGAQISKTGVDSQRGLGWKIFQTIPWLP